MKTGKLKVIALSLALSLLALGAVSQVPTRVQVLFTGDLSRANTEADRLEELGYGPAEVREIGTGYKVLTRAFDSYGDANFYKLKIRASGYPDAFPVKEPSMGDKLGEKGGPFGDQPSILKSSGLSRFSIDFAKKKTFERPEMTDALRSLDNEKADELNLFTKAMAYREKTEGDDALAAFEAFIRRFPKSEKAARAKLMRGYWLLARGKRKEAKNQFEALSMEHPSEIEAGEAQLRCGYIMILERKPDPEILKRFLKLARGEVKCDADTRIEAMMRCAALYYRMRDLDTSEAAYQAIEGATGDVDVQGFARMQRAGILLEKAYNGKVPYEKACAMCDSVASDFPEANIQTRSTAALMALEALCRQGKYKDVVERSEPFFKEYLNTPEAPIAHYWIAKGFYETGQPRLALQVLEDVLSEKYETGRRFKFLDVNEHARKLESRITVELGEKTR